MPLHDGIFDFLNIVYGALVGLCIGITGGGGAILSIPLLVYAVRIPLEQAVTLALGVVFFINAFGMTRQIKKKNIDFHSTIYFSLAGMVISPLAVKFSHGVPDDMRLILFALLMLLVSFLMLKRSNYASERQPEKPSAMGHLKMIAYGVITGFVAGMFGVGGGFVIVPMLVLGFGMPYKLAVGTSMACVVFISSSALVSSLITNPVIDWKLAAEFFAGGVVGLWAGMHFIHKISEQKANKAFASIVLVIALFMLIDKLILQGGMS